MCIKLKKKKNETAAMNTDINEVCIGSWYEKCLFSGGSVDLVAGGIYLGGGGGGGSFWWKDEQIFG